MWEEIAHDLKDQKLSRNHMNKIRTGVEHYQKLVEEIKNKQENLLQRRKQYEVEAEKKIYSEIHLLKKSAELKS